METGATDGAFLRAADIPTYGVSGVFLDMNDIRSDGRDERIMVKSSTTTWSTSTSSFAS